MFELHDSKRFGEANPSVTRRAVSPLLDSSIRSQLARKLQGQSPPGQSARCVIQNEEFGRSVVQHGFGNASGVWVQCRVG